jgi:hypothetical protein
MSHFARALLLDQDLPEALDGLPLNLWMARPRLDGTTHCTTAGCKEWLFLTAGTTGSGAQGASKCRGILSWILATNPNAHLRNGTEAVRMSQRACELTGRKDPAKLKTLAEECLFLLEQFKAFKPWREQQQERAGSGDPALVIEAVLPKPVTGSG